MKFKYLNELADIVVNIDEDKNIFDGNIIGITEHAIRLIAQMKLVLTTTTTSQLTTPSSSAAAAMQPTAATLQ